MRAFTQRSLGKRNLAERDLAWSCGLEREALRIKVGLLISGLFGLIDTGPV